MNTDDHAALVVAAWKCATHHIPALASLPDDRQISYATDAEMQPVRDGDGRVMFMVSEREMVLARPEEDAAYLILDAGKPEQQGRVYRHGRVTSMKGPEHPN